MTVTNLKLKINRSFKLNNLGVYLMNENYISAREIEKEFGLYLKVVTSVKAFDNYNPFFNIFDQDDSPCRRIVVLTPHKDLEEVYDENPDEPINSNILIEGNLWIEEFPLTMNPKNIPIEKIVVSKTLVKEVLVNS